MNAFLDGSGDSHLGLNQTTLTLGCVAAYKQHWDALELPWKRIIEDRNGGKPIHANKLLSGKHGPPRRDVVQACVDVIVGLNMSDFHLFGCSVNLRDYERAKAECPHLQLPPLDDRPKPAHAVCVDWCTGHLFDRLVVDYDLREPVDIEVVFDRSEKFRKWMHRVWKAPKNKRPFWAKDRYEVSWDTPLISSIRDGKSASLLPLQAADTIAWIMNRHHTHGDYDDWYFALRNERKKDFMSYDFSTLVAKYVNRPSGHSA